MHLGNSSKVWSPLVVLWEVSGINMRILQRKAFPRRRHFACCYVVPVTMVSLKLENLLWALILSFHIWSPIFEVFSLNICFTRNWECIIAYVLKSWCTNTFHQQSAPCLLDTGETPYIQILNLHLPPPALHQAFCFSYSTKQIKQIKSQSWGGPICNFILYYLRQLNLLFLLGRMT